MKDIRYWVSKVLTSEQSEVEKKPEPKHSVTEKMKFLQEQSNYQQEQKTLQQKKTEYGTVRHLPFSTLKIAGAFSFLRKEKCTRRLYQVHFLTFQINRGAFLFGIMSAPVNHSQSDRPVTNPAECGTHDARPSFRLKRGLYFSPEAVRRLPVCE